MKGLAGQTDAAAQGELERLLRLRADKFSVNRPSGRSAAEHQLSGDAQLTIMRNFMYMTPELANYLRENVLSKVRMAWEEYNGVHPFWFISRVCEGTGENTVCPLWDHHTLFHAKAQILEEPYEELVKYLDIPAYRRGDLYYIDNLCALLETAEREAVKK